MSAITKARVIWIYPAIVLASWLVVRMLAASPGETKPRLATSQAVLSTPAAAASAATPAHREIRDDSLRELIARFADDARASLGR